MNLAAIMPIYEKDRLEYIRKAIESILGQTYDKFRLFIFVDGPVSKGVEQYLKSLNDLAEIIFFPNNRGLAATLNDAIKYVQEKGFQYIARMDADDIALPERFEQQIKFLEEHPNIDALGTQAFVIDSNNKIIGHKDVSPRLTMNVLKKRCDIIHPSIIFRSNFFERFGYYLRGIPPAEDYELWFRAVRAGANMVSLKDRLYYFRYDENLISRRRKAQKVIIDIKRNYLSTPQYYHLLPHYFIKFAPNILIKLLLRKSIKN